ncbi:MAG: 50S ribosomal protein L35 [Candidatus Shapirobacteria bacterium]|nr:50S ribosomal protein L35 [Candidatus Shapirobacteria bacterium]
MKSKKLKIRKSIIKRFRITKNGKVLFRGSHVKHLRRKKQKSQLRAQKVPGKVNGAMKRKIKKLLGK